MVSRQWWEQAGINLELENKRAAKVDTISELESDLESESNADPGRDK